MSESIILESETISFYEVPLVCGAAPDIGCASRSKPALIELEKNPAVKEAWFNRPGTVIAIVWKDKPQTETITQPIFDKNNIEFTELSQKHIARLRETFREVNLWYRGTDVDALSQEEAITIAESSVKSAFLNKLLNENEVEKIKFDIEVYFKKELIKIRTNEQLNDDSQHKFKEALYRLAEKHIGRERAEKVIELNAINGIVNSTEKNKACVTTETKKDAINNITIMNDTIILESVITCPHCGHKKNETMPTDACQYFYQCENCKTILKPLAGDCCVFCSYGSVKCPPIQQGTCACEKRLST